MNSGFTASLAAWLLTVALHGGLLLALAGLADRTFRLAPAARESIWRCALFGGVVTASLQSFVPAAQVWHPLLPAAVVADVAGPPVKPPPPAQERALARRMAIAEAHDESRPVRMAAPVGTLERPMPAIRAVSFAARFVPLLPAAILILWLAGVLRACLRLCLGLFDLRRTLDGATRLAPSAQSDLAELARQAGAAAPDLYTFPDAASPFALGRRIVVPDWALVTLDARQLRAMLAHELAHLIRRDPEWKIATACWCAGFWFLPFAGLAQRRLENLAELACDAFAVRHTGDARIVAECLAACAERHVAARACDLVPAMIARRSPLIHRIDHLLEGAAMFSTKPGFCLRAMMATVLAASVFGLPAIGFSDPAAHAQTPPAPPRPDAAGTAHSHISITNDGGNHETIVTIEDAHHDFSLVANGKIEFTPDETDVASLSSGGNATFEETHDGTTHRLELAERDGKLERHYFVDRHEQAFDAAAHAWFAALLPSLIRESGLGAEARVRRIHAKGGAAAVLAEIEEIHNDHARGLYIGLLADEGQLAPADLERCLRLAGALGGDYEKHRALAKIFAAQTLSATQQADFLRQASRIGGDYERAELLTGVLPKLADDAEVRAAWFSAATSIGGDYERGRALRAMLDRRSLSGAELSRVLNASATMGSDYAHSQLLIAIARHAQDIDAIAPAYVRSTRNLNDHESAQALLALIRAGKIGAAGANAVLDAAGKIGNSHERGQIMIALARAMPNDAALVASYREAASHLDEYDRKQAERVLPYR